MAQVIEEDTHDNYVVCQGWDLDKDPECKFLINRFPVAKPYSLRGTFPYRIADMLAVAKIRTHLGDTPGVAADSTGQPENLGEDIEILLDDLGNPIAWMIVEGGGPTLIRYGLLRTVLAAGESCIIEERVWVTVDGVKSLECNGRTFRAFDPDGEMYGIADEAGVRWLVDPNGPTADQLDDLSITLPEGAGTPSETEVASLQRITCVGFVSTCSNYWEPGECTGSCVYEWDGEKWVKLSGECVGAGCVCPPPWYDGWYPPNIGQQVTVDCMGPIT